MTEERLEKIEKEGAVIDVVSGGMGGIQHFTVEGFPVPGYTKAKNLLISRKQRLKMKEEELLELTNQALLAASFTVPFRESVVTNTESPTLKSEGSEIVEDFFAL